MSQSTQGPSFQDLEVVKNKHREEDYVIKISIPEFNCVCPNTGLPDFATINIKYVPNKLIVELKSLKLYVVKYRNLGIFHEDVTNRVLKDFKRACSPKKISVHGDFVPRGGIKTEILAVDNM